MTPSSPDCRPALSSEWLGRLGYDDAVAEMSRRRARVLEGDESASALLLCEHPPVITMGRSAARSDVLATSADLDERGVRLARSDRGGEVTYHGPGQLMIYPVVRLRAGLLPLLESVGLAISEIAAALGISGAVFRRSPAGVWVGDRKIAACGVHLRRRVMTHGFAVNLATPPSAWQLIVPCGMSERPMASITELGGREASARDIAEQFGQELARAVAVGAVLALR